MEAGSIEHDCKDWKSQDVFTPGDFPIISWPWAIKALLAGQRYSQPEAGKPAQDL